ncbi:hypothetical protein niasHT_030956 [Heterodera trifolii]|uniref:C2H2-type domain-containing protein n=1 Tax=Heterodera trifolii TaxID=157864 RepID=A0ABD2J8K0_9BILA
MTRNTNDSGKRFHMPEISSFCNTYVEAQNKKTTAGFGAAVEEFTGQFLCTFQSCNKRLRNNVMFMHHIWAHIVQQKPNDEQFTNLQAEQHNANNGTNNANSKNNGTDTATGDEQLSDVIRLHMCPECLLEQPTPHRAHLHYHRVHKRGKRHLLDKKPGLLHVCNICEQVFDAKAIASHRAVHHLPDKGAQLALPYGCRFSAGVKCQFRASNRGALLRHFCFRHVGTHVVLCPFCLHTFPVPPANKRCSVVRMREFVKHMALHDGEKSLCCDLCVVKFPLSEHLLLGKHKEQQHTKHKGGEPKWLQWQMQRMDLKALVPDKSRALVTCDLGIPQCVECGQMVRCLAQHLGKERRCCSFCAFATRCAAAMERHRLLSKCNAAAKAAWTPILGWTSPSDTSVASLSSSLAIVQLSCVLCTSFRSVNVKALAEHIAKVHHQMPFTGKKLIAVVEQHLEQYTRDISKEPILGWTSPSDTSVASLSSSLAIVQLSCVLCTSFRSVNVKALAEHIAKVHHQMPFTGKKLIAVVEQHLEQYTRDISKEPILGWTSPSDTSVASLSSSLAIVQLSCVLCTSFRSVNVKALAEHIAKVHHQMPFTGKKLIAVVEQHLEQYTRDISKEEHHEAELFGLRHIDNDTPLEKKRLKQAETDNDRNAGDDAQALASSAGTKNEHYEAMHGWLSTFLPLLYVSKLNSLCANQPQSESMRLLVAMKAQDDAKDGNDDGTVASHESLWTKKRATVEKKMDEFGIRMGLVLGDFPCHGSTKTFSDEKRPMKNGCLKAELKDKSDQRSH